MVARFLRRLCALAPVLVTTSGLTGCEFLVDIFQVGFWVGVILVVLVIIAIWLIVRRR